jgi:hypothetical protein
MRAVNVEEGLRLFHFTPDIWGRLAAKERLGDIVSHWLAERPDSAVVDFMDTLFKKAALVAARYPRDDDEAAIQRRLEEIYRIEEKRRFGSSPDDEENNLLTDVTVTDNVSPVKSTMANLLDRLNKATSQRGMKSKLAKVMGVPLSNVSQWLSGEREPGGETTLRLLNWVIATEAKPKSPGGVGAPPEPKTQLQKSKHENQSQARNKR